MRSDESGTSFDLFSENTNVPTSGRPTESLLGSYDAGPNTTLNMSHAFTQGQIFKFGAEGNWFSDSTLSNTVTVNVTLTNGILN